MAGLFLMLAVAAFLGRSLELAAMFAMFALIDLWTKGRFTLTLWIAATLGAILIAALS